MTSHKSVIFKNVSLVLPHKICFEDFNAVVPSGSKIAVMGNNGLGKSTLLKAICALPTPVEGEITASSGCVIAYVPQIVENYSTLSGAQRFHKAFTEALAKRPDVLLLDEPTNHLDASNRYQLLNMLSRYNNTLICATHDPELLKTVDIIWHIAEGRINVFRGNYDDYLREMSLKRQSLQARLNSLEKEKILSHKKLMREQQRAAAARRHGEALNNNKKWAPIIAGGKKRLAQNTAGAKSVRLAAEREEINAEIGELNFRRHIAPSFNIPAGNIRGNVLFISGGAAGYDGKIILNDVNLSLNSGEKLALVGDNAVGKTTFFRAVADAKFRLGGIWQTPPVKSIGLLDQHYNNISGYKNALDLISSLSPSLSHGEIRRHLNDFLFRKNEEVSAPVNILSGGERARLSLAAISCLVPDLLLLDEITNNIDLETRGCIEDILRAYPGAFIIISHDMPFLRAVGVTCAVRIKDGRLIREDL